MKKRQSSTPTATSTAIAIHDCERRCRREPVFSFNGCLGWQVERSTLISPTGGVITLETFMTPIFDVTTKDIGSKEKVDDDLEISGSGKGFYPKMDRIKFGVGRNLGIPIR